MQDKKNIDPAFPVSVLPKIYQPQLHFGLTKREYFAGMALQGLCSYFPEFSNSHSDHVAKTAVQLADAIIEALK